MAPTAFFFLDLQTILRQFIPDSDHPMFDATVLKAKELLEFARELGPEKAVVYHVIVGGAKIRNDPANYSVVTTTPRMQMLQTHPLLKDVTVENHKICPELTPLPGEIVMVRPRVSAFHDTDLNATLRSLGITDIVLSGVATRGIVLSTFTAATDHDYQVTVIKDACGDSEAGLHRELTERYFARGFAGNKCMTVEELKASFGKA